MRLIRVAERGFLDFFKTITHHANGVKLLQKVYMKISQLIE